ncbi:MAG: class I SAM-dependent methyltransferase [Flavobacteriales bacterium]|jgi:SAM-dependent methyltransferase|nr:class I SAM-dependent methyltransferase [Flavobacteriales bacterium]
MEWFETWFDSKYYHILYKNRDDEEAQAFIDVLLDAIGLEDGSNILDLACGKGRHSIYLSSLGYRVKGVDLSVNSIEAAQSNEHENLSFEVKDMRTPFTEDEYDLVANLFTSFGYFDDINDNLKVLNSIETMMNEDGHFVIDFMNVEKVLRTLVSAEEKEIDGVLFQIKRQHLDGYIVKDITVIDGDKTFEFQEKVQALTIDNFKELIAKTDLIVDHFYGSYDLTIFDADTSDRLIIVGTKW